MLESGTIAANGMNVGYLEAGPKDGPLALCLHGFPDTAHTYRYLLPALGDAGYRAVAPFSRGYAPTDIPADGRYQTGALAADAIALHEALGGTAEAVLIGHDWGAGAAYGAAGYEPERWSRVVTMAVPPAGSMAGIFFDYAQIKRSFYMFFFQSPIADMAVPLNDFAFIAGLWADWSPGYPAEEDVGHVRKALEGADRVAAAIGYYRAMFDRTKQDAALADIQAAGGQLPPQPLLYLHGGNDGCVGVELARGAESVLTGDSEMVVVADTGHFLHLEQPDAVNRLILNFLAR